MKLIENTPVPCVSVNAAEYFVLLRPSGIISKICAESPEASGIVLHLDRKGLGAIIQVPTEVAALVEAAVPGHVCDEEFRRLMTEAQLERDPEPQSSLDLHHAFAIAT